MQCVSNILELPSCFSGAKQQHRIPGSFCGCTRSSIKQFESSWDVSGEVQICITVKQIPDKGATRQYWIYLVGELCTEEIQTPIQSLHDLAGLIGRSVYQSLWQCFCLSLQWSIVLLALWMLAVSAMRLNPDLWLVKCSNEHSTTFNLMDQLKKDQFIQNCGSCMFLWYQMPDLSLNQRTRLRPPQLPCSHPSNELESSPEQQSVALAKHGDLWCLAVFRPVGDRLWQMTKGRQLLETVIWSFDSNGVAPVYIISCSSRKRLAWPWRSRLCMLLFGTLYFASILHKEVKITWICGPVLPQCSQEQDLSRRTWSRVKTSVVGDEPTNSTLLNSCTPQDFEGCWMWFYDVLWVCCTWHMLTYHSYMKDYRSIQSGTWGIDMIYRSKDKLNRSECLGWSCFKTLHTHVLSPWHRHRPSPHFERRFLPHFPKYVESIGRASATLSSVSW